MPFRTHASWLVARLDIRSDRGASAVEYGIMIGVIAAALVLTVAFLGTKTSTNLDYRCPARQRYC
jgi:Flp pilus assembly pilin Flp